jgi:hypothetical protein
MRPALALSVALVSSVLSGGNGRAVAAPVTAPLRAAERARVVHEIAVVGCVTDSVRDCDRDGACHDD